MLDVRRVPGPSRLNMSHHIRLAHTVCQCFWRCPGAHMSDVVRIWTKRERPSGTDTQLYGRPGVLLLWLLAPVRPWVVWAAVLLWSAWGNRPGSVDGPDTGSAFWTRTQQQLCSDHQSGIWNTSKVFSCSRPGYYSWPTDDFPGASVAPAAHPSICDLMRQDIAENPQGAMQSSYVDAAVDIPVVELLSPLIDLIYNIFSSRRRAS